MRWSGILSPLALAATVSAINLDISSEASIKSAAATIAYRMMANYTGNQTGQVPGLLPQNLFQYYWWEAGSMFGTLVDYWHLTGDTSYNDVVKQATLFQVGTNNDFQPVNQTKDLGNDDQVFWAFTACDMYEFGFSNPDDTQPSWLSLAQAVFNTQVPKWDTATCGGGLKWQKFWFNNGYDYKNSASNMGFFNLAARLGLYTGNQSYLDWAVKSWDWSARIGLYDNGHIYDGSDDTLNCTEISHLQFTYNSGMAIYGAAVMYQATNKSQIWADRVNAIWNMSAATFLQNGVMYEQSCELNNPPNCNLDMRSFKAPYSRFLAYTTKYATWLTDPIFAAIQTSAKAAAASCVGGQSGDMCSTTWTNASWDGTQGIGQQMGALSVISMLLIKNVGVPLTNFTGGTSVSNPSAGITSYTEEYMAPITMADRAGAGIVTAILIILTLFLVWWGLSDEMTLPASLPFWKK